MYKQNMDIPSMFECGVDTDQQNFRCADKCYISGVDPEVRKGRFQSGYSKRSNPGFVPCFAQKKYNFPTKKWWGTDSPLYIFYQHLIHTQEINHVFETCIPHSANRKLTEGNNLLI